MSSELVLLGIVVSIVAALAVAKYAELKGQNFLGFLLLGVFGSALLAVAVTPRLLFVGWMIPLVVSLIMQGSPAKAPKPQAVAQDRAFYDSLDTITRLRDEGTLTTAEFHAEKQRLAQKRERLQQA